MSSKVKVTVGPDSERVRELSRVGRQSGKSRSRLVGEALECWHRNRLAQELKVGYRAMAREDLRTAKAALAAQRETAD